MGSVRRESGECVVRKCEVREWGMCGVVREFGVCGVYSVFRVCGVLREWGVSGERVF